MLFLRNLALLSLACFLSAAEPPRAGKQENAFNQLASAERKLLQSPESEADRVALAVLYLELDQNRKAVATLQEFTSHYPKAPRALRMLATALLRQEDYAAAARALKASPRDSSGVYLLAMATLGLQDTNGAEKLFRESLTLDPRSVDANFQLGLLYTKKGSNLAEAIKLLERARSLAPRRAGIHTALGSALLQADRAPDAVKSLVTATQLDPAPPEAWYVLANAYRQLDDKENNESALLAFNARSAAAADHRAREMRSRSYYEQGVHLLSNTTEIDKANQQFEKAISEMPNLDAAYYRMAQVSYLKNDLPRAVGLVREAIHRNAFEPEYYYVQAKCLESSDPASALAAIRKAVALRPGVSDFEAFLRILERKGIR